MKRFCKVNTCTADFTQKLIQNNNKKNEITKIPNQRYAY